MAKKISKSDGARAQRYLTILHMSNGSERLQSHCTVSFMLL